MPDSVRHIAQGLPHGGTPTGFLEICQYWKLAKTVLVLVYMKRVYVDSPTDFVVDSRAIAKRDDGKVTCTITNPSGTKTENLITPQADGTYRISYTPFEEGRHTIDILYDGLPIPGSPFVVNVRRGCDPKKCRAFGPGLQKGIVEKANAFTVETKGPPHIRRRAGAAKAEGGHSTGIGFYTADLKRVRELSPSGIRCDMACELEELLVDLDSESDSELNNLILLYSHRAGTGGLGLSIEGPSEAKMTCKDNRDGSCSVEYIPTEPGEYDVSIRFADQHIPGSPFKVPVDKHVDASLVKAYGPGLEPSQCRTGSPLTFKVDASKSGKAPLDVKIRSERGTVLNLITAKEPCLNFLLSRIMKMEPMMLPILHHLKEVQ
uniref:Uncharacterized protein n=1 Tax=Timema tahoe TaxID=61484 RepID=A0A7R9IFB8_9NEOP|nr:unnamed protein product [Timema tahoe]